MKGSTPKPLDDPRKSRVTSHRVSIRGRSYYVEPIEAGIHVYPTDLSRGTVYPSVDAYDDWRDCVSQMPLRF